MGWSGGLDPRCDDVQRDSWYSGVYTCTPQCCWACGTTGECPKQRGLLPSWSQGLQPISQKLWPGLKRRKWLVKRDGKFMVLDWEPGADCNVWFFSCLFPWWPHCPLGFYIHSDSCSTAFLFWDIFSSRKKKQFFFSTDTYELQPFPGKDFSDQGSFLALWDTNHNLDLFIT